MCAAGSPPVWGRHVDKPDASVFFRSLSQFTQAAHEGRRLSPLLSGLITRASELPGVDAVRILLADDERQVLVAQPGLFPDPPHERPVPIGIGFAGRIAQTRRPMLVPEFRNFPVYGQAQCDSGIRSAVGVPLLIGDRLVGVIHIGSCQPGAFSPELIPELQEVAARVALTVDSIRVETALAASEQRFRTLFEDAPFGVCLTDLNPGTLGHILLANEALSRLTGYSSEQLSEVNMLDLLVPDHRTDAGTFINALAEGRTDSYAVEREMIRADGSVVWVVGQVAALSGAEHPGYAVCYLQDVSARKLAEADLVRRAFTDALTGLANRHLVMDHLALALRQEVRTGLAVGVLYLDVDHFKEINDTHGHDAGDRVLREIAARLTLGMRSADTPGRLGGDEFIVVCPQLASDTELTAIANRLLQAACAPVQLPDSTSVDVAASIGIATGDRNSTPEEVVRRADAAMYEAKRQGRRRWYAYTETLEYHGQEGLAVDLMLLEALEQHWFVLHYQPIVDLQARTVIGVEALLRIQHPERGLLAPDSFIGQLERSDVADEIETWVIAQACRDWSTGEGVARTGLTVNVSGRLAASGRLCQTVLAAAGDFPLNRLTIEMTERAMVKAGAGVIADMQGLADRGIGVAIDDFGTGFASLTYLQRFPVTMVKIDRSFVAGLGQNARDDAIVRAVITLGASLDMAVVAEGVETQAQSAALRSESCPLAQGFLFSHPLPVENLRRRGFPPIA
jgi:diguanylate cyclase (GGDEF)-like protein/PAS domain S-box-containing protein